MSKGVITGILAKIYLQVNPSGHSHILIVAGSYPECWQDYVEETPDQCLLFICVMILGVLKIF